MSSRGDPLVIQTVDNRVITVSEPTKKKMTRVRAFWLWFRFVLLVAGLLTAACFVWLAGSWAVTSVVALFNQGSVLLGLIIIGSVASLGIGTWIYLYQRHENPKTYER